MKEISLTEPAGILVKTTCVDYPGRIAGSFFLKGCNLRCPYCYNTGLVNNEPSFNQKLNTLTDLFNHLEKRQGILSGLVISGGEPLLNPSTPLIIRKARSLGYKIKLDTNGTLPEQLKKILEDSELKPDFIAMDIKTSPQRYASELFCNNSKSSINKDKLEEYLLESLQIISSLPSDSREFRTVLVPGLITKEDIKIIAGLLPEDSSWQFAQFQNSNCLDEKYNELYPYTDKEVSDLVDFAKSFIPGAQLR